MNSIVRLIRCVPFLLAVVLFGCSAKEQEFKWTEDVQLQDGQVITIKRHSIFRGERATFSNMLSWYSVELEHPVTKEEVRWESQVFQSDEDSRLPVDLEVGVVPSLDLYAILVKDGEVSVLTRPAQTYYRLDCPDPPYLIYRWRAGSWQRVPLEEAPYRKFAVNVSIGDISLRETLLNRKHLGTDVTATQKYMSAFPYVIDLTRMSKQTFGQQQCRGFRAWTERDASSN